MKIYVDGSKRAAVSRMFPIWESMGHELVDSTYNADVQLSVIKINVKNKKSAPVVLRLNGIYYNKADNNRKRNAPLSKSHRIADAIVYQSDLSRRMCEKYLDKRTTDIFEVIHNGVDPSEWKEKNKHSKINIVSCAKWRRHKRLPEMIELFNMFMNKYPNSQLHILGPMKKGAAVIPNKNVIYHNPTHKIGFKEIQNVYKTADIYLHLSKKDSCPSSVVEAIAAGIPVVTTNACGGATEMCRISYGCSIVDGEDESIESDYIYRDPYNKLSKKVKNGIINSMIDVVENHKIVNLPMELRIDHVAHKYIEIMKKVLR